MRCVIADIHGRCDALKQVLKRAKFNNEEDTLILLGDVVDGGTQTKECVDELLKIKHLIFIRGNHDQFWIDHLNSGWNGELWLQQGGANTLISYGAKVKLARIPLRRWDEHGLTKIDTTDLIVPASHQDFFNKSIPYYVWKRKLFVHGGFNPDVPIEQQDPKDLMWDRALIQRCRKGFITNKYDEIFVGHTTTQSIMNDAEYTRPVHFDQLWGLDTGAGWNGKLTLMSVETKEVVQSDQQEEPK